MVLRDRDTNGDPTTLEERRYYCQNFRGDVSAIITDTGKMVEWVKYSAYGTPFGLPAYDVNSDGDFDTTDVTTDPTGYDVRWDFDLDGDTDIDDVVDALSLHGGTITLGRGTLSASHTKSRKAYAGYERDATFEGAGRNIHHVRYRVYDADTGRWNRRDPQGYVDGLGLYEYVTGRAVVVVDPTGLAGSMTHPGTPAALALAMCAAASLPLLEEIRMLCEMGYAPSSIAAELGIAVECVSCGPIVEWAEGVPATVETIITIICGLPTRYPVPAAPARPSDRVIPLECPIDRTGPLARPRPRPAPPPDPRCPPCPPGISRLDRVPPGTPHFPCPGDHWHIGWNTGHGAWPGCHCSYYEMVWCLPDGPWVK